MKKIMNIFVLVAAAAMALVSCQRQEVQQPTQQEHAYTFILSPEVKAALGNDCVVWEDGDKIGVYTDGQQSMANKEGSVESGQPVSFKITSSESLATGDKVYCYFPYAEENSGNRKAVNMSIATQQAENNQMPMVSLPFVVTGTPTSDTPVGKILFANLGSIIEFNVYSETTEYQAETIQSVAFNADKPIAGDFTFDLSAVNYSDEKTLAISGDEEKTVVSTLSTPVTVPATKDVAKVVKMVVAPGSYKGEVVVTTDKATYTFPINTVKEFKRSAVKPLGLNLRADVRQAIVTEPVEVTATLTFDANKTNRTFFSADEQIWEQNGLKFTNAQGSSTSSVADYADPVRLYKSSTIKIEAPGYITKIEFQSVTGEKLGFLTSLLPNASVVGSTVTEVYDGSSTSVLYSLTTGQIQLYSITVTYSSEGYIPPALESIALEGDYKTEFKQGDDFSYGGVIIATYSDESTKTIPEDACEFSGYDKETIGKQIITVTYEGKTATYEVNVAEAQSGGDEGDGGETAYVWTLVTDVKDLAVGDEVIIAAKDYNFAIGAASSNGNNRTAADITKSDNILTNVDGVTILTLQAGTNDGTYALYTGSNYLYAASSSSNYLKEKGTKDANGSWKIEIASDGEATIKAQGTYTRNVMQYNQTSSLFACYSSASQKAVVIYKLMSSSGNEGGDTAEPIKLEAPVVVCSNRTENSLKFEWPAVQYASMYEVTFHNNTPITTTSTSYEATGLNANTKYKIFVKAVGDGTNYTTSDAGATEGTTTEAKPKLNSRNLAFSPATATATMGQAFTAPTLSGVTTDVTYSSSDESVATVDASTGAVTLVAAGRTIIKASAPATDQYEAGEASYTLDVSGASAKQEYTYTWTSSSGALGTTANGTVTKALNSVNWTIQRSGTSGYTGWTSNVIQIGKNGAAESLTMKTSGIEGTIKSVSVECSSYQAKHNVSISVGGVSYVSSKATSSWTTVGTIIGEGGSSGVIEIKFTAGNSARALYIKSIKIVYEN